MGEALSKWIEGSLSAMGELEAERDRQSVMLEAARRDAEAERGAIEELDRHITQFTRERKKHRELLMGLEHEITVGESSLDALEGDLEAMAKAIEKLADRPVAAAPRPASRPAAPAVPPSNPASMPAEPDDIPTATRKKTVIPPPPKPPGTTQRAVKAEPPREKPKATEPPKPAPAPKPEPAPKAEPKQPPKPRPQPSPELELQLDGLDEAPPRSRWRAATITLVVLAALAGGGYAAVQTETGARVFEDMRSGVRSLLGS